MSIFYRRVGYAIGVLLVVGLAACQSSPQYRTDTSYIAPPTTQGASCVASCETTEQVCRGREDDYARAEYPACLQRADSDYKICMQGEINGNCALYRDLNKQKCEREMGPSYESCTRSFNACYESCGGEVKQETVCVKNCD